MKAYLICRPIVLHLHHHDPASSGKRQAILLRLYSKGRDLYDFMWYLSHRQCLPLLNNALTTQTRWAGPTLASQNWPEWIAERIRRLNWQSVAGGVWPFGRREQELNWLALEQRLLLLERQ